MSLFEGHIFRKYLLENLTKIVITSADNIWVSKYNPFQVKLIIGRFEQYLLKLTLTVKGIVFRLPGNFRRGKFNGTSKVYKSLYSVETKHVSLKSIYFRDK